MSTNTFVPIVSPTRVCTASSTVRPAGTLARFAGRKGAEPIAAPLVEVLLYITGCFASEYDAAENILTYDSELGEYMGETWTTRDLLETHVEADLPNDGDGVLMEALCDGLEDRLWCRSRPNSFSDDEKLNYSWDSFCELIKHDRRYFFLRGPEDQELFSPLALLRELEGWCRKFELISTLPAKYALYRARHQDPGERLRTPRPARAPAAGESDSREPDESAGYCHVLRQR